MQQLTENALATGRGLPGDVGAPPPLRVSQVDYTIGFGLFAPTLPRDHPVASATPQRKSEVAGDGFHHLGGKRGRRITER